MHMTYLQRDEHALAGHIARVVVLLFQISATNGGCLVVIAIVELPVSGLLMLWIILVVLVCNVRLFGRMLPTV